MDVATYTVYRWDRNRRGGGIMLILKSDISAVCREDLETDPIQFRTNWVHLVNLVPSSICSSSKYRPSLVHSVQNKVGLFA